MTEMKRLLTRDEPDGETELGIEDASETNR